MDTNNLVLSQEEAEQMQKEDMEFVADLYGGDYVNKLIANTQSEAKVINDAMNKRMVQIRKSKKISQIELAKKAGISVNSLRLYEAGKRSPTFATLQKIADALGVSWYELLSDNPHEQAREIINDVSSRLQNEIATNGPMQKVSDPISSGVFQIQFKSDDDHIAYLYSLLNDPGKFEASRCFFRHLDKESIPEVIAYLQQLANTPQYQKKVEE
mgnify:CR=1 FL=1